MMPEPQVVHMPRGLFAQPRIRRILTLAGLRPRAAAPRPGVPYIVWGHTPAALSQPRAPPPRAAPSGGQRMPFCARSTPAGRGSRRWA